MAPSLKETWTGPVRGCLRRSGAGLLVLLASALLAGPVRAQSLDVEPCTGLLSQRGSLIQRAAATDVGPGQAGLTFIGHSTFLIESPGGIRIATDYNDFVKPQGSLDVVTMNHAHGTHYTDRPSPEIPNVLRGWSLAGGAARYDLTVGDVRVRNVPTNIRDWGGGTEEFGNSIFVFEVGGLCIAHLGHLHHTLLPGHLKQLGRIDVLLVPVDGSYTMDVEGMVEVIQAIHPSLIIPMHIFSSSTLERFLGRLGQSYPVERSPSAHVLLSRAMLPPAPQVLVLAGR